MLEEVLSSVVTDVDGHEEVAELVVTALGTSGAHYICWKTYSGEYKQRSYGLPKLLEEWLFPIDGTTRDFATLQVILLGNDAFRASDKNGEIRNDEPGSLQQLRRALTFNDENLLSAHQRHLSRGRDFVQNMERPRSSTLPATLSRESSLAGTQLRPLLSHARALSVEKPRLRTAIPVTVRQQRRRSPLRPRSIDFSVEGDLAVLEEHLSPQPSSTLPNAFASQHHLGKHNSICECHEKVMMKTRQQTPTARYLPTYTDASVQTEPESVTGLVAETVHYEHKYHHNSRETQRDSRATPALLSNSNTKFPANNQRSGLSANITRPDSGFFEPSWDLPPPNVANPIAMGKMQDYFRSTTYVLGAALYS
ncbi:hypothetical protein F5Y19DRAFT_484102 [Xylariaceae sp. FL1651]|nr:hypothetical protein F5Y19DRAFT_484102 [Xylariaceae sp. FL1651]